MESLKIEFLESFPDGIRRLTTHNWSGACVVIARKHFDLAPEVADLACPGVYILVGPSEILTDTQPPRLISRIYIGKSDTLDERLRHHHDSKEFWSTAFAFYRMGEDLHSGQTGQLEALLIDRARSAGNHVLNVATPRQPEMQSESESIRMFVSQIEAILKALGHDLFSAQNLLRPIVTEAREEQEVRVPDNLQGLVSQLKQMCLELPQTEFYSTRIPDLRAKVVHGESSRVFATIKFRRHAVRLKHPGGSSIILDEHTSLSASVRDELQTWHAEALQRLAE